MGGNIRPLTAALETAQYFVHTDYVTGVSGMGLPRCTFQIRGMLPVRVLRYRRSHRDGLLLGQPLERRMDERSQIPAVEILERKFSRGVMAAREHFRGEVDSAFAEFHQHL